MFDYREYLRHAGKYEYLSRDQKIEEIRAINRLLYKYGLQVTSGFESVCTVRYNVKLNPNSPVSKLLKMRENFCIALNDDTVTVTREKAELIIEKRGASNTIYMGDLYNDDFKNANGLTIMLGKDTKGNDRSFDLRKAPHVLVAGTTGSGKSVWENVLICSLFIKNPDIEVIGIDTKRVEFQAFANIPSFHLVTDADRAADMLSGLCNVMENRYEMLTRARAKDIDEYNAKGNKMNPIVVVIDEFADLMLLSGKDVERYVVRLAQKARACGIHLIIATQRPTTDVVTGLIKANIPTRICMKVNSGLDSRIILDRKGGETLMGHGDMLYLGNGDFEPVRIQGAFITPEEEKNVVNITNHILSNAHTA